MPHAFRTNLASLLAPTAPCCLHLGVIPPAFVALSPPSLMRRSCIASSAFWQTVLSSKIPFPSHSPVTLPLR